MRPERDEVGVGVQVGVGLVACVGPDGKDACLTLSLGGRVNFSWEEGGRKSLDVPGRL